MLLYIDLAGIVLDKCITREDMDSNGTPCTTQMAYNYEFVDDFDEPKLTKVGNFVLKSVLRYKIKGQQRDFPLVMINNHHSENGNEDSLMSSSSITSAKKLSIQSTSLKQQPIIQPAKDWGPKVYDKSNHTLTLMVILSDTCYL